MVVGSVRIYQTLRFQNFVHGVLIYNISSQLFLLKKGRLKQVFSWLSLTVGSYFDLSLVLFSTRIQKEKDKKVDWVSVNDGFSNDLKTIHFVENLGMTYVTGAVGLVIYVNMMQYVRKSMRYSPLKKLFWKIP